MSTNQSWNDSLDEMLEKLNNGDFVDQSISEFEKTITQSNRTSTSYSSYGSNGSYRTNSTASSKTTSSKNSYSSVVPHIDRNVESATYPSRYLQVITCLENIVYDRYPYEKQEGYQSCINYYIELVKSNNNNLKPVEQEVENSLKEYKQRTSGATVDGFLQGYYDALLMVKKCLYNSKLARLQVLSNRVSKEWKIIKVKKMN